MTESEVRERAFAMPLTSPAYPPGPCRFVNREQAVDKFPDFGLTFGNPDFVKYAEAYGARDRG